MKLTLSSTSMMQPVWQSAVEQDHACSSPPQRLIGMLGRGSDITANACPAHTEKTVQYQRPHQHHVLLQTVKWGQFLAVDNTQSERCVAVFGYEFDGQDSWYQLWNTATQRLCWILHSDDMIYAPYAILIMDALVSLLPRWDGNLYCAPGSTNHSADVRAATTSRIDARLVHTVLVSDASTDTSGKLWFLVTLQPTNRTQDHHLARSGWISH